MKPPPPPTAFSPPRRDIISGAVRSRIEVAPNPNARGDAPLHEIPLASQVPQNDLFIQDAAGKYGIDPNLLRAVIFMETTHGWYDGFASLFGRNKSILPTNINTKYWGNTWVSRENLKDPRTNVFSGAKMLESITIVMPGASVAQIASVYNDDQARRVSDYGARVQRIYDNRLWSIPQTGPTIYNEIYF